MKKGKFKFSGTVLWFCSLCMALFVGVIISVRATNFAIPEVDVTYNNWEGILEVNENETVKISGVTHSNDGTTYGSAIRISGNSTVNLVFEGDNVLVGNSGVISAGIEVAEGSTVNIYGADGSSLTVTGGKYSAGIGGIGYGSVSATAPNAGNINIYSGNITAIGGDRGAGIGSGYHSSVSNVNIYGGNITALGTGSGAGIGSGYGTSGGSATAAGVGFYNAGNITISGGTVKAAAYHMNFDNFDPYNTKTLYGEEYSNTHAAGIGGGYGASSGVIVIEGNADVIAIGASGGAGIGSGRGTSKPANYDAANFNVDITIKGNAKVIAMATNDTRSGQTPEGGAAIGLGRGCTIEGDPKGSVTIGGNANVYAVAPYYAQAIGGSRAVGSTVIDAHLSSINLETATLIMVISDGQRDVIDYVDESDLAGFVTIDFSDEYFQNHSDFFAEDKFPLRIATVGSADTGAKTILSLSTPENQSCMVRVSGTKKYSFVVEDYQGGNGETIFVSNAVEENNAEFFPDQNVAKQYDATGLTARLDRDVSIDSDYGELKFKINAQEGIFEYGSTFFVSEIEDQTIIDELNSKLDEKYADNPERILYFDIGVEDRNGENYGEIKGGKVRVYVQMPDRWDRDDAFALFVTSLEGKDLKSTQKLETIDGVTYLSFETDCFGSYVVFDPINKKPDENDLEERNGSENSDEGGAENGSKSPTESFLTGDNIYFRCVVWAVILMGSFIGFVAVFRRSVGKRFKK